MRRGGYDRRVSEFPAGAKQRFMATILCVDDEPMILVDTAGIRRRGSIEKGIERYSVLRSMKAIDRADVAIVKGDVTSPQEAEAMVREVEAKLGPVEILVNNAGITRDGFFHKIVMIRDRLREAGREMAAMIEVATSGSEVPAATMVRPRVGRRAQSRCSRAVESCPAE